MFRDACRADACYASRQIVGTSNPVIMVANKVDLLPKGVQMPPIERWIKAECRCVLRCAVAAPRPLLLGTAGPPWPMRYVMDPAANLAHAHAFTGVCCRFPHVRASANGYVGRRRFLHFTLCTS